jgi:polysaccharide export outer membrane protein
VQSHRPPQHARQWRQTPPTTSWSSATSCGSKSIDVVAAGKTPAALRDTLTTSLKEYITNPVVTVIVVEAMPQTISVIGEVNSPGTHPIKGETTVIEALALAGGFKDFANTKNITIQRATPTGVKRIPFNYKDAIKSEGKPMCVEPGDVIIVP